MSDRYTRIVWTGCQRPTPAGFGGDPLCTPEIADPDKHDRKCIVKRAAGHLSRVDGEIDLAVDLTGQDTTLDVEVDIAEVDA